MKRREFIGVVAGAAAWPLAARAQQAAMPTIGFLHAGSPEPNVNLVAAFRKGLAKTGHVEGQNVAIEFRWAAEHDDRLPELAADLVRRRVVVIAAPGTTQAALAAKAATAAIPIVFSTGGDPVALGLVASFNHPGGNVTGIVNTSAGLAAKRLGLLRQLAPQATHFAVLVTRDGPLTSTTLKDLQAPQLELHVDVLYASNPGEIDTAIAKLAKNGRAALMVGPDAFLTNQRKQIVALTAQYALPAVYSVREFAEVGGLMSYGPNFVNTYEQVGVYTGSILKGTKPAELPVEQSTQFELVINVKTAKALGLPVSDQLVALADELVE
jgi:putative ABC transport system substrate-binding protein